MKKRYGSAVVEILNPQLHKAYGKLRVVFPDKDGFLRFCEGFHIAPPLVPLDSCQMGVAVGNSVWNIQFGA